MAADTMIPMDRGLEPQRKPFRALQRAARRRAWFVERIARAKTPEAKLDAAVDLLRATVADRKIDPAQAATVSEQVVRYLVEAADQLTKTIRRDR